MTIIEILVSSLLDSMVTKAIEALMERISASDSSLAAERPSLAKLGTHRPSTASCVAAIKEHLEDVERWARVLNFDGPRQGRRVSQVALELDAFVVPLAQGISDASEPSPVRGGTEAYRTTDSRTEPLLAALTARPEHCVILGQAGAGKTTSIQKICDEYFRTGRTLLNHTFPIVVRLNDIAGAPKGHVLGELFYRLARITGLSLLPSTFSHTDPNSYGEVRTRIEYAICEYLENLSCVILLDGFDEVVARTDRSSVLAEIKRLVSTLNKTKVVLTSRSSDFPFTLQNTKRLELAPLTKQQITEFASRWFQQQSDAERFLEKLFASPFADTAARPLTVAHLCAVFEFSGSIPEKPKSVYRRLVRLLLEEWDSSRDIKRSSKYAQFDSDMKEDFLAALAFHITSDYGATRFDTRLLTDVCLKISSAFGLPKTEAEQVVKEIESHSGLIIESGSQVFEFSHKSLQEYFAAHYIVRLPAPQEYNLRLMPNEMAIAISLSSNATRYFTDFILSECRYDSYSPEFYATFVERLRLEKIDFTYSELAAIAACIVLERAGSIPHFWVFAEMLRGFYPDALLSKYRLGLTDADKVSFILMMDYPEYRLPRHISLHREIHERLTLLPIRRIAD